jgi:hypothetical protein
MQGQGMICTGVLPEPAPHDEAFNTHRLCLDTRETGHGIFDLQINRTDAWYLKRFMDNILNPKVS